MKILASNFMYVIPYAEECSYERKTASLVQMIMVHSRYHADMKDLQWRHLHIATKVRESEWVLMNDGCIPG
jgi:hypothetical protein